MSHVDNVILAFSIMEEDVEDADGNVRYPIMDRINTWLGEIASLHLFSRQTFGPDLGSRTDAAGGYKPLETPLFVAAFNYFPEQRFMDFLRTLPWRCPDDVQYIVKRQHEERFVIRTLSD